MRGDPTRKDQRHGHCHHQPGDRRNSSGVRFPDRSASRRGARPCGHWIRQLSNDVVRAAGDLATCHRRPARSRSRRCRSHDDRGDGQDACLSQGRNAEVRQGFSLLRRPRCRHACRRAGRRAGRWRQSCIHALPATRRRLGDHAVELPAVAGGALRGARVDGG